MDRKKAIYLFAIIETLVYFIIIGIFLLGWLSLTGFIIAFAVAMLISMSVAYIIIRKTQ
jgi:Na+/H+ antiporter NhaB